MTKRVCSVLLVVLVASAIAGLSRDVTPASAGDNAQLTCDKGDESCDAPWYCYLSSRLEASCQPSDVLGAVFYAPWVIFATVGLGLAFVAAMALELRPFRVDEDDQGNVTCGSHDLALYNGRPGTVEEIKSGSYVWSDGQGAYGGGSSRYAHMSPGGGGPFEVSGFNVQPGHQLVAVWAKEDGDSRGAQALRNLSNGNTWIYRARTRQLTAIEWLPLLFLVGALGITLRWAAIPVVLGIALLYKLLLRSPLGSTRARKLERHIQDKFLSSPVA